MSPDLNLLFAQPWFAPVLFVLVFWTVTWKGFALWRAAKDDNKVWFVLLLILNTLGVLEIVYLFAISPMRKKIRSGSPTKK